MSAAIRVVVADDHPVLIEGIKNVLAAQPAIAVVGVATAFAQVPGVLTETAPDVLILDLAGMGDSMLALMHRLRREHPRVGVIIFSTMLDYAAELIDLGVRGYVTKTEMAANLVQAISAVARGDLCFSPLVTRHLEQTAGMPVTPRELYALKLYVQGLPTAEIATEMHIKPHSVQNLFNSMFEKTQCKGRRELARWYKRRYGNHKI
ncbi:MAG: response regulator transcription factor [Chloroflexales bacterium]|nr:response regulator transcription factor [Chloroflexales bacterium]